MKHKKLIIGLLFVALVFVVVIFGKPYHSQAPKITTTTEQSFDPEALAIRDKLYAKSKEYGAKTKRQTELQLEIDQLEGEKNTLAGAAAGYDRVLCADFKLQYARPAPGAESGSLVKGCDF